MTDDKKQADSAKMPADPRDQAWLLWRARLEGRDPFEVTKGWWPKLSGATLVTATMGAYAHLMGNPDSFGFNGGSGNWPWTAAAAKGDLAWAERAAAADLEHGIGRLELGSPEYSPDRLLAQSYLLSIGIPGSFGSAPSLRELVRRQWLLHSLAMVPTVPHKITIYGHDGIQVLEGNAATAHWFSGWTCTLPQTRVNSDSMVNGLLSYLVTKAMGASATYRRHADPSPDSPYWPLYALDRCVDGHLPAATAFLAPGMVQLDPGDIELAGLRTSFRWSLYRTDAGTACWTGWRGEDGIEPGPTTFKPTSLFNRADRSGEQWICQPQRWARETDDRGESSLATVAQTVECQGRDTHYSMELPPGEPTLWLEFGPEGARRVA